MRAQFVFEKFTQDSDPIRDMGIGLEEVIKEWILKHPNIYFYYKNDLDMKDTGRIIFICIAFDAPKDYVEYLVQRDDNYNKSEIISYLIRENNKKYLEIIDYLLKAGGKIKSLDSKYRYVKIFGGKVLSLTSEEELTAACYLGDYSEFLKQIKKGALLKIGMINGVFKKIWNYQSFANIKKNEYDKIINYLKNNISKLEKLIHPRDLKKIDKIKRYLQTEESNYREYPRGYKIYRILKYIDENNITSKEQIRKFLYEISYGKNTYNHLLHSTYWTDGFRDMINPSTEIINNRIVLNERGKHKLDKLKKKFDKLKVDAYL